MGGRGIVGECCIVAGGLSPWRFLLSQEWSVGGRECVGVFWHCVVCRLRRILRGVAVCNVRFLLSQEWSVGERECVGVFWYYCRRRCIVGAH